MTSATASTGRAARASRPVQDGPDQGRSRRADAHRNLAAILDAGLAVLCADPDAGLVQVARRSGLTRTTVYAHFASREQLMEALVGRAMQEAVAAVDAGALHHGAAGEALRRVLGTSWQTINQRRGLSAAAAKTLSAERMAAHHKPIRTRLLALIERGQRDGTFRPDVPPQWLLGTYFALVHLAGDQVAAGALSEDDAELVLLSTVTAAFSCSSATVSSPESGRARQDQS